MLEPSSNTKGQPGIASAALFALCPRCGAKGLFDGLLRFAPKCQTCELDYHRFNVGDGASALVILGAGFVIMALAALVQVSFHPPAWVHAILWLPVMLALVIYGLRFGKAALLASEFRNNAGEGRLKD